jgi:hypothetical protein
VAVNGLLNRRPTKRTSNVISKLSVKEENLCVPQEADRNSDDEEGGELENAHAGSALPLAIIMEEGTERDGHIGDQAAAEHSDGNVVAYLCSRGAASWVAVQ